ncbi:hypothetical protein B1A_01517, partial [mine drainage metagenome]
HAALRPGGRVGFTLEALEGDAECSELSASGRYRHTRACVQRVLDVAGFREVDISADTLRREAGRMVTGWVVVACRGVI